MKRDTRHSLAAFAAVALLLFSTAAAHAARVESVVPNAARPVDPGCVGGPIDAGGNLENWWLEQGRTYTITLADVIDCANMGTDSTIIVEVVGLEKNTSVFMIATKTATGEYVFDFTMPSNGCGSYQIKYCLFCIETTDGFVAGKQDGTGGESDLHPGVFNQDCTIWSPVECPMPVESSTWGHIKSLYR